MTTEWINVDECVPKHGETVLVWRWDGGYDIAMWHNETNCGPRFMSRGVIMSQGGYTHWMRLPDPPSKDNDN